MAKSPVEIPDLRTASTGCGPSFLQLPPSGPTQRTLSGGSRAIISLSLCARRAVFHYRAHAATLESDQGAPLNAYVVPFEQLRVGDVETVGGKNGSLGEMIGQLASLGVRVPTGFATTAKAYRDFLAQAGLDARIRIALEGLDVEDVTRLAATGGQIRKWILETPFPQPLEAAVIEHYRGLSHSGDSAVAVRSSATAEDLPEASFAGQQETFLNVRGATQVLKTMHEVFASLFNDRAIAYRAHHG